jgi:transmembrane sensor
VAYVVKLDAQASIEFQARKWLVRMDGDKPLTEAEKEALREWMSRSALHRGELVRLTGFWNQANILTELIASLESKKRVHERRRGPSWGCTILMAASAILASVILVYFGLRPSGETGPRTYGTVIGQQKTIFLSDGSSIQLNTDSQVNIAYSSQSRRIRLLRGEAVFSATPDPNRVFEVYVADSVVRAVGTTFAVHLEGRKVDVTVTKGIVDVSDVSSARSAVNRESVKAALLPSNSSRLKAGEVTRFDSGNGRIEVQKLAKPELQRRLAWREGYLVFSGAPLSEVVTQLNRYSTTTLEIGDSELASIAIGGRFRCGDLDAVLDLLNTTFAIRARQVNDRTIRLEPEREP